MDCQPNFNFSLNLEAELLDKEQVSYLWKFIASEFRDAACRCAEERNVTNKSTDWCPIATGVLLALSAELYLKYLITEKSAKRITPPIEPPIKSQNIITHNLFKLFNYLDEATRNYIVYRYFYAKYSQQKIIFLDEEDKQIFNKLLEINQKMFENWRYLYENNKDKNKKSKDIENENRNYKPRHLGFMKDFVEIVESIVNNPQLQMPSIAILRQSNCDKADCDKTVTKKFIFSHGVQITIKGCNRDNIQSIS